MWEYRKLNKSMFLLIIQSDPTGLNNILNGEKPNIIYHLLGFCNIPL